MSGARIAVRTRRTPDDLNTPAKRAPSFVSWSQMATCGASSMVAFLACCAHHSSAAHTSPRHGGSFGDAGPGRRVRTPRGTARRTSVRSRTPTSRGFAGTSTSFGRRLRIKSAACTAESFACKRRYLVRAANHGMRSAPQRGLCAAISRKGRHAGTAVVRAAESAAARTRGILRDASEEWSRAG